MTMDATQPAGSSPFNTNERTLPAGTGVFRKLRSVFSAGAPAENAPFQHFTNKDLIEQDRIKFVQNINEVQMLLDHISGNPIKNLAMLNSRIVDPDDPSKTLKDFEVVKKISEIGLNYTSGLAASPPSNVIDPNKAAFLVIVKDALNSIAYPATGSTIAFTTLFTQSAEVSRTQAAAIAYPSLLTQAATLKWTKKFLTRAALILAIIAAIMLWQVTYGVQLAAHFDEAKKNDGVFAAQVYTQMELEHSPADASSRTATPVTDVNVACGLDRSPIAGAAANSTTQGKQAPNSIAMQRVCGEYAYQHALLCVAVGDLGKYGQSLPFLFYGLFLPMHDLQPADVCGNGSKPWLYGHQEDAKSIAAVLAAMSNYFVPLLFGAVGALASLVRSLSDKVAENLLSPRDLTLWLIRLPISVVAGVCVGLFLTPSSVQSAGSGSIGSFAISASGIAFLAGYGAESFFGALDSVIARLFGVGGATKPNSLPPAALASQG